jgi:imidazolonepropionase-like amidohydrolase
MTKNEIEAAYEEAHKWGKNGACHAIGSSALKNVIEAGVDIIDHGAYMDENTAEIVASKNIYFTPTLSSYTRQTINPCYGRGEEWIAKHMPLVQPFIDAFTNALKAGVKFVCGTDSVGRYAEEVFLFRKYGMTPMDSLMSCTKTPAEALGMIDKIGTVEVNKQADLIILDGNPLEDVYALEKITYVVKDGVLYYPDKLNLIM